MAKGVRVEGKKALITGAAGGLGSAMARRLAQEGAKVSLADLNLPGVQAVADEINRDYGAGTAFAFQLDVTAEPQWIEVLDKAAAAMGGLSVLVNNAGIMGAGGGIEEASLEDFRHMMAVNVDSVFLGCKHALKHMQDHQPGSIVNISSIAGLIAAHNAVAYNASKAAVWLMSKSVGLYCAKKGWDIRSNSVHPTFIDTQLLDPLRDKFGKAALDAKLARQVPLGRLGAPVEVADAVLYLASDESRFMTASELKLDGGISAM